MKNAAARSHLALSEDLPVILITCPVLADAIMRHWLGEEGMEEAYLDQYHLFLDDIQRNDQHGVFTGLASDLEKDLNLFNLHKSSAVLGDIQLLGTQEILDQVYAPLAELYEACPWMEKRLHCDDGDLGDLILGALVQCVPEEERKERPWARFVRLPDHIHNMMIMDGSEVGLSMEVLLLGEEGLEEILAQAQERGDQELIDALEDDSPETLHSLIKRRGEALSPKDPVVLAMPDTADNRSLITRIWESTLLRVKDDVQANLHDRRATL